jgi:hypothetical protein
LIAACPIFALRSNTLAVVNESRDVGGGAWDLDIFELGGIPERTTFGRSIGMQRRMRRVELDE